VAEIITPSISALVRDAKLSPESVASSGRGCTGWEIEPRRFEVGIQSWGTGNLDQDIVLRTLDGVQMGIIFFNGF
jgi:hypothetical protein